MKPQWIKASIALATFGTILVILFSVMSGPFDFFIDQIDDESSKMNISSDVDPFLSMVQLIFGTVFAISMFGLVVWFFLGSHQDEHEQYTEQVFRRPPGGNFYE